MKKFWNATISLIFIIIIVLFVASTCMAENTKTGSFTFGAGKDYLGAEDTDFALNLYLKGEDKGTQIDLEMNTQIDRDILEKLNVLADLREDVYLDDSPGFLFGELLYEQNTEWQINKTEIGLGAGHRSDPNQDSFFVATAGFYLASNYFNTTYDQQSLLKAQVDYTREIYAPVSLNLDIAGVIDCEGIHKIDNLEKYQINISPSIDIEVVGDYFAEIRYEWGYFDMEAVNKTQWATKCRVGVKL